MYNLRISLSYGLSSSWYWRVASRYSPDREHSGLDGRPPGGRRATAVRRSDPDAPRSDAPRARRGDPLPTPGPSRDLDERRPEPHGRRASCPCAGPTTPRASRPAARSSSPASPCSRRCAATSWWLPSTWRSPRACRCRRPRSSRPPSPRPCWRRESEPRPALQASPAEQGRLQLLTQLERNDWNIAEVARLLGVTRRTVYMRLRSFGIERRRVPKLYKKMPGR